MRLVAAALSALVVLAGGARGVGLGRPAAPGPRPSQQPESPVAAVVSHPAESCPAPPWAAAGAECVPSYVPRWLESAGFRVVPLRWAAPWAEQRALLSRVNAVVIPGGGLWGPTLPEYIAAMDRIVRYARAANAAGDPFVVFGICYGLQMIAASYAGGTAAAFDDVVVRGYRGMWPRPAMLALNLTAAGRAGGRLFNRSLMGPGLSPAALAAQPLTLNWHSAGVNPWEWDARRRNSTHAAALAPLTVLATNTAPGGFIPGWPPSGSVAGARAADPFAGGRARFVSAAEDRAAEVYATQFHPERAQFEFRDARIGHGAADIALAEFLGRFLASRARRNRHTFADAAAVEAARLAQWPLVDRGYGTRYYFLQRPPAAPPRPPGRAAGLPADA